MKFVDEAVITVQSGNGGRGCVSFRREKFIPRGGPDGGDGGTGADVILVASLKKRTLYQFRYRKIFRAENGRQGLGRNKTGKSGQDLLIEIPVGSVVTDANTGRIIKDFATPGEKYVLAKGGRGGQGNARFKTSKNRTPRFAQPGEPGITLKLNLELKLLADVGIICMPNAGKSTLISAVSSASPKIADYPFTTLSPNLGVVHTDWTEPFLIADIPGLIAGAHQGVGLGIKFLRHIERTQVLIHMIDISSIDFDHPLDHYETINRELEMYDKKLMQKPQLLVLNKIDLPDADEKAEKFQEAADDKDIIMISALEGIGLKNLKSRIVNLLESSQTN